MTEAKEQVRDAAGRQRARRAAQRLHAEMGATAQVERLTREMGL